MKWDCDPSNYRHVYQIHLLNHLPQLKCLVLVVKRRYDDRVIQQLATQMRQLTRIARRNRVPLLLGFDYRMAFLNEELSAIEALETSMPWLFRNLVIRMTDTSRARTQEITYDANGSKQMQSVGSLSSVLRLRELEFRLGGAPS